MENLFSNKRTYIAENGDELVNMCIPSVALNKIKANSSSRLNSSHNGRLDKFVYECVSKSIDDGLDLVMYYNHIFNPFAVQEEDILYTPLVNDTPFSSQSEPELPDGSRLSDATAPTQNMTYAQKVEYFSKLGLGIS